MEDRIIPPVFDLTANNDEDYTITYRYDANNRLLESVKDEGSTETITEYSYDDNGNQLEKEVWIDNSFDSSETSVYKMEQPSGLPEGCHLCRAFEKSLSTNIVRSHLKFL